MITTSALLVMLTVCDTFGQSIDKRMKRRDEMDGKTCKSTDVLFSMDGPGYVGCVALCGQNPNCKSLFHNPSTGGCTGCDIVYANSTDGASVPDEAGTKYYVQFALYGQACDFKTPCSATLTVCEDGACVCDPAANFNPGSRLCTSGCTTYGTTYQKYLNRTLYSYNAEIQAFKYTVDSCLERCSTTTAYMCYGVDHNWLLGNCGYNSENARTKPGGWRYATNVHTYVRNCEKVEG